MRPGVSRRPTINRLGRIRRPRPRHPVTAPAAAPPQGKRPPQAKTQPEYEAYKTAVALTDAAAAEKASDDFAAKFPDSELRVMLYKSTMRIYQRTGNSDKIVEMGRKGLAIDGDDPELLVTVASELAEKTRDTDLDKDQRLDEAMKMSQKALQTVDTDISIPAGTPRTRSTLTKASCGLLPIRLLERWNSRRTTSLPLKRICANLSTRSLRSRIPWSCCDWRFRLDRQGKYPEALKEANHAVELTQDGTGAGKLARQERDRLNQFVPGMRPLPNRLLPP